MSRSRANLLLLLTALLWGFGNVAQKTVLDDLGPTLTFGLRSLIGLLVIAPFVFREARRSPKLDRSVRRGMAAAAAFFCLGLAVQQRGYAGTTVTNASFFVNTMVVFTPAFAWLLVGERPRLVTLPAIGAVTMGVLLMGGGLDGLGLGDAACLVSAVFFALWIACVASVARTSDRPFTLAACQFGFAGVLGTGLGVVFEPPTAQALAGAAPELVVLGVFSTGIAFTLQAMAQRATPTTDAAIVMSAESVFGAAAAALILGERVTPTMSVGAGLILTAILVVQLPRRAPKRWAHAG